MLKKIFFNTFLIFLILCSLNLISASALTNISEIDIEDAISNNLENVPNKIYLTFDDGISPQLTKQFVDMLNKHEVKGTFFLIGNTLVDNQKDLKELVNSGHAIGVHSFTHESHLLYKSKDAFIKEMIKTRDEIENLTGIKTNLLRFPFGSKNNVFRLDKDLEQRLHDLNFRIFDWNVDTNDGVYPNNSPYKIYKASLSDKNEIILLMHCTSLNKNSLIALDDIIPHYKNKNYSFEILTDETPEIYSLKNAKK
ncbi:MAG: polysaccharide deacetylase family protein [Sarcina sp.]